MAAVTAPPTSRAGVPPDAAPEAPPRRVMSSVATVWRDVGPTGRLGAVGLLLSGVVALVLGHWIPTSLRHHLLEVRTEMVQGIVDDLADEGLLPLGEGQRPSHAAIGAAVEHRLIGGEIVRAAVRDAEGTVVYGEVTEEGPVATSELPHIEQHPDGLLHFHLPVLGPDRTVRGSFEVFQEPASFDAVLVRVRRNVWLAIATGLGTLALAMGGLTLSHARAVGRRRRHAEQLLRQLLQAEDRERRRVVGSLHDDIGQPLYRILYGLEGCRSRLDDTGAVQAELDRLGTLVREIDGTLRAELRQLHPASLDALDLASALRAIARNCREESDLVVHVDAAVRAEPSPLTRSVLLRATQEALTNVRKHAAAREVRILAVERGQRIVVEVEDDGGGCREPAGLGITTTRERLTAVGGGLSVRGGRRGGTVFRAWAPTSQEGVR